MVISDIEKRMHFVINIILVIVLVILISHFVSVSILTENA